MLAVVRPHVYADDQVTFRSDFWRRNRPAGIGGEGHLGYRFTDSASLDQSVY
jgi:hypothetical protein